MNCRICNTMELRETNFSNLFRLNDLCSTCQKLMELTPLEIEVPTDHGIIDLIVMFPGHSLSPNHLNSFAQKYEVGLKIAITSNPRYDIVLFFEEAELVYFERWFPYFQPYSRILLLTLSDLNFETSVMFR